MSTFNGLVAEFPEIRIDFFRNHPDAASPLACFLSHVHSDHLAGLESLRSPFVYCSAATRQILLRLERYPCRINYGKGILEARQQTFKHLRKVLKPLPLDTPTCVELQPGRKLQVTLLDANHCPGAVMFLIEGNGKAILYTGDMRSEYWLINSITRNPAIVEFSSGLKRLDKIYLDTSFTDDIPFQPKAEGIRELLEKVSQYPDDTVFNFQAWTYGYEDVWIALSKALKSQIHVDDYKLKIYQSLKMQQSPDDRFGPSIHHSPGAPALVGFMCGNSPHPGCLTSDTKVRLHSCEKGNMCAVAQAPSVVRIQPVIAHLPSGGDLSEVGVGGGGDDLEREAELDHLSPDDLQTLLTSIFASEDMPGELRQEISRFLTQFAFHGRNLSLDLDISSLADDNTADLEQAIRAIAKKSATLCSTGPTARPRPESTVNGADADVSAPPEKKEKAVNLPKTIRFPYSRHSSYPELCAFVDAFRPRDVWPCTVNPEEWVRHDISIGSLFGRFCSSDAFDFDTEVLGPLKRTVIDLVSDSDSQQHRFETQLTTDSVPRTESSPAPVRISFSSSQGHGGSSPPAVRQNASTRSSTDSTQQSFVSLLPATSCSQTRPLPSVEEEPEAGRSKRRRYDEGDQAIETTVTVEEDDEPESQQTNKSFVSDISIRDSIIRQDAYSNMIQYARGGEWTGLGLVSTTGGHTRQEPELGHVAHGPGSMK